MPTQQLAATLLSAPQPQAPVGMLPIIVPRKEAVKKFMEGGDAHKGGHKSDIGSSPAMSVVGNNLVPPISRPMAAHESNPQPAEYTIQMLHGMPSPCKIRASPAPFSHSPDISKFQLLAGIETIAYSMLSDQGAESPPTISKNRRLARIERTIDGIIFSALGNSSSDPASPQLQRLHGALLNSRSPDVQLSKSKSRRVDVRAAPRDPALHAARSLQSRLARLEHTVSGCFERISVSQDGNAGSWHWDKFQRLQRIEERLDQILTVAGNGVDTALRSVQLDPIVKRNQLLPHVLLAAAAQERRLHALNLMKLQGKNERELHAALAFKREESSECRHQPRPFVPVC